MKDMMMTNGMLWGLLAVGVMLVGAWLWFRPRPNTKKSYGLDSK